MREHIIKCFLRSLRIVFFTLIAFTYAAFGQNDLNNRLRLAQNYEQNGDYEKAESLYSELHSLQPKNIVFFEGLFNSYLRLKKYNEAYNIINEKIKLNSSDPNLYFKKGSVEYYLFGESKAIETWDETVLRFGANESVYRMGANYSLEKRLFEKAVEYLKKGKEASQTPKFYAYDLAQVYAFHMRYKEAADEYCYILSISPDELYNVQNYISQYINSQNASEETLPVILKNFNEAKSIVLSRLLAFIFERTGDYENAFEQYVFIEKNSQTNGSEIYSFSERAFREGKLSAALKGYDLIVKEYLSSPYLIHAKIGYARTMEKTLNEQNDKMLDKWKPVYKKELKINSGEFEKILKTYEEIIKANPNSEQSNEANYRIGLIKKRGFNKNNEAELNFKKVTDVFPLSEFAFGCFSGLSEIEIERGDFDKAEEYCKKIINYSKGSQSKINFAKFINAKIEFWRGNFDNSLKELGEVLNWLDDNYANDAIQLAAIIKSSRSDSISLIKYARADYLAFISDYSGAEKVLDELTGDEVFFTISELSNYRKAELLVALDEHEKALAQLKVVSDKMNRTPYGDDAALLGGKIYFYALKDNERAKMFFEELIVNYPKSLLLEEARSFLFKIREIN